MKRKSRTIKRYRPTRQREARKAFFNNPSNEYDENSDIEVLMPKFESLKSAKKELNHRIDVLAKSEQSCDLVIHDMLSECGQHPCNSPACPRCYRKFRKWFFAEVMSMSSKYPSAHTMTLLYYSEMMTDDELESFCPTRSHNRLRKKLERCGFKHPVVGCLELDYHVENGLWLHHYHLLTFDDDAALNNLRKSLNHPKNRRMKTSAKVDRPFRVDNLNDPVKQISYMCKSFSSRITVHTLRRRTIKGRLRNKQEKLILNVKHRMGYQKILFLYGARRAGSKLKYGVSTTKSVDRA